MVQISYTNFIHQKNSFFFSFKAIITTNDPFIFPYLVYQISIQFRYFFFFFFDHSVIYHLSDMEDFRS